MKRLFYGPVMLLFLSVMLFASCQNESSEKKELVSSDEETSVTKRMNGPEVEVKCNGNCDGTNACGLEGVISSTNGESYIRCKCSGCTMQITTIKGSKSKITNSKDSKFEVYYVELFQNYIKEQYNGKKYTIVGYHFISNEKECVETYSFDLGDGKVGTVILVGSGNAKRMNNTVKIIDCTGTCDCREVYNLETGNTSCSCSDCTMKVTTVKERK